MKKAKIGCFTYEIHFTKQGSELCGLTELHEKKIFINTRYSEQVQKETLFHELMHVALEDYPFPSEIATSKDREDHEEHLIRISSPKLVQILQDNKWIRDFIFSK